jgi:hypothetical protein
MTTDMAFEAACFDLDFANKIWESNDKARYHLAEAAYKRAVELRNELSAPATLPAQQTRHSGRTARKCAIPEAGFN